MTREESEEIWKDIVGYEGSYQISNFGRVKSLNRFVSNGYKSKRPIKGQILKTKIDRYGYEAISLSILQKCKHYTIHRLVAIAFISNPENKATINHIDGNKLNNNVENLEWNSNLENIQHSWEIGLRENAIKKGENSNFAKLKEEDILFIRTNYNKKILNMVVLAKIFNITASGIGRILRKQTWKHI